jgi:Fe2+ transport system protein B
MQYRVPESRNVKMKTTEKITKRVETINEVLALAIIAICAMSILFPIDAHSMRCGNDLAQVGDTAIEVRHACGAPLQIWVDCVPGATCDGVGLQQWVYDVGGGALHVVDIRKGRVVRIWWIRK